MAKSVLKDKQAKAAAARARMAKRSKRQRWIKENKKRITYCVLGFILLVFLAIFTPFGPDFYYNNIQMRKMESPTNIAPGTLKDLYSLAMFYQYTFRTKQALEVYNEMAGYYYVFKLTEYANNPDMAWEKRRTALNAVKSGGSKGPPFTINDIDMPYVGLAIFRAGEIMQGDQPKQFVYRIYKDLYLEEFKVEHPEAVEEKPTELIQRFVDKVEGRR